MCHQEVALICDVIRWVKKVARRSDQMDYGGEKVRENVPLKKKKKNVTLLTVIRHAFKTCIYSCISPKDLSRDMTLSDKSILRINFSIYSSYLRSRFNSLWTKFFSRHELCFLHFNNRFLRQDYTYTCINSS